MHRAALGGFIMNKIHLSILLCVLIGFWACGSNDPGAPEPDPRIQQVVDNSRVLRDAVEAFAAQNDGWYPANLVDVNLAGNTVVDLLPGGQMLENPFTGERTSPIEGVAQQPGEVGFMCLWAARVYFHSWDGCNIDGYWITGSGQTAGTRVIDIKRSLHGDVEELTGSFEPALEDSVLVNCMLVATAAEEFALDNDGDYPRSLEDADLSGNTLIDLLPAAERLVNPETGLATEPVHRDPIGLGSTAYDVLCEYPVRNEVGYRIIGRASFGDFVISNAPDVINMEQAVVKNCLIVQAAAEAFAAHNSGIYAVWPSDVGITGQMMIDYMPNGALLENPFTHAITEPCSGGAVGSGSTGYTGRNLDGDGVCDGYLIDGIGGNPGPCIIRIYVPPKS
jgi:hypothetical protein